ncbi:MAG: PTS sugar transporter subunit IIA [Caulobacteraceae bacterium]
MTMLADLLDSGAVLPALAAGDKRRALAVVAETAARSFGLEAPRLFEAMMEREARAPTGVGHGVAVPHCHVAGLHRMRGVFVRLQTPVEYGAVDDKPVDLIFALFSPVGAGSEHLRALARISRVFRQPALREQLRSARNADGILALLVQEARPTAA